MITAKEDLYSVEFFDLQLRFARKVAELSGIPLADAVGSHTNFYVRLGMGPRLDAGNPDWQDYLAGLATARDQAAWTHDVHCRRLDVPAGPTVAASVGCFSYALIGQDRARLHFHAGECASGSPLSIDNRDLRRSELTALISKLKAASGANMRIVGASWLYNLDSYRSLFPEPYLASLQPMAHPYQRMPLWGQFLRRDRSVRLEAGASFRENLARTSSLADLDLCFPFRVLTTTAPLTLFS